MLASSDERNLLAARRRHQQIADLVRARSGYCGSMRTTRSNKLLALNHLRRGLSADRRLHHGSTSATLIP